MTAIEVASGLRVVRFMEDGIVVGGGIAVGGKRVEEGEERRWWKGE